MAKVSANRVPLITLVAAFCSHATVVHCIITDSRTGSPLDSVKVVFSFNDEPQSPVYTDSSGSFFSQAPFNGRTSVQLTLSKNGFGEKVMNYGTHLNIPDTITISTALVPSSLAVVNLLPGTRRVAIGNDAGPSYTANGRLKTIVLDKGIFGILQSRYRKEERKEIEVFE